MQVLLHLVGTIVVLPYIALAMFFLFIGQIAEAKGMTAIIKILWENVDRYLGFWFYAVPLLWIALVAMGLVPQLQRIGSLSLCLLAIASFVVIVTMSFNRIGVGEFVFLLPCLAIAITSAWLCFRA